MADEFEQELDQILAARRTRLEKAGEEAAANRADAEAFNQAAAVCMRDVVAPALSEVARALNKRNMSAQVVPDGQAARIYFPQPIGSEDARLAMRTVAYGVGGLPYLQIAPDPRSRRIRFERNSSGSGMGTGLGDVLPAEVTADVVKAKVMTLVREVYGAK